MTKRTMENDIRRVLAKGQRRRGRCRIADNKAGREISPPAGRTARKLARLGVSVGKVVQLDDYRRRRARYARG